MLTWTLRLRKRRQNKAAQKRPGGESVECRAGELIWRMHISLKRCILAMDQKAYFLEFLTGMVGRKLLDSPEKISKEYWENNRSIKSASMVKHWKKHS